MKIHFLNIFLVTVTLVSFCTMSNADNLSGTGDNLGGGWRSDGNGVLISVQNLPGFWGKQR